MQLRAAVGHLLARRCCWRGTLAAAEADAGAEHGLGHRGRRGGGGAHCLHREGGRGWLGLYEPVGGGGGRGGGGDGGGQEEDLLLRHQHGQAGGRGQGQHWARLLVVAQQVLGLRLDQHLRPLRLHQPLLLLLEEADHLVPLLPPGQPLQRPHLHLQTHDLEVILGGVGSLLLGRARWRHSVGEDGGHQPVTLLPLGAAPAPRQRGRQDAEGGVVLVTVAGQPLGDPDAGLGEGERQVLVPVPLRPRVDGELVAVLALALLVVTIDAECGLADDESASAIHVARPGYHCPRYNNRPPPHL